MDERDLGGLREHPDVEKELVRISYIFDFSLTVLVSDILSPSSWLRLPGHLSQRPSVCLCDTVHSLCQGISSYLPPFPLIRNFYSELSLLTASSRAPESHKDPGSSPCLPLFSHWMILWSHSIMVGSYLTLSLESAQVIKSESRDFHLYQHSCNTVLIQFCKEIKKKFLLVSNLHRLGFLDT